MIYLIYTILCILCLCIGFFVGQKYSKKEKIIDGIKIPNYIQNVKESIEEKKNEKEIQEQLDEINRIAENIENYNGTSENQKELKNIEIGIL